MIVPGAARWSQGSWFGLAILLLALSPASPALTFFAMGDAPYHHGALLQMVNLLDRASREGAEFIVHIGDIKAGSRRCDDSAYQTVQRLFARQSVPVIYTPGDNEWTDCRRKEAGGYDPEERLAYLRRLFYGDPGALRLGRIAERFAFEQPESDYPELQIFSADGTLFVVLHVVGTYDNYRPRIPGAVKEHEARQSANRRLLARALEQAESEAIRSAVLLFHANPGLKRSMPHPAYRGFVAALQDFARAFGRPVLLIHGDTHSLKIDRPYADDPLLARVQRLEVQGHPRVGGVMVRIDQTATDPFSFSPIPDALDAWETR